VNIKYKLSFSVLLSLMLLWIPARSYSDGIYVTEDRKHALGEHTTLKLTKSQIRDVEQRRTVILNESQLKQLRKLYGNMPKKLEVLSSRWDDCTCGMGIYAIWCRPGEIDIPHSRIEANREADAYTKEHPNEVPDADWDADDSSGQSKTERVIIDSKAAMFIGGKLISEKLMYERIDRLVATQAQTSSVSPAIFLDVPPPIDEKADQKIKTLIDRLEQYCRSKGVDFYAMGMRK